MRGMFEYHLPACPIATKITALRFGLPGIPFQ